MEPTQLHPILTACEKDVYGALQLPRAPFVPFPASDQGNGDITGRHRSWTDLVSPITFGPSPSATSIHLSPQQSSQGVPGCRYSCLSAIVPFFKGFLTPAEACDLLDIYFADPGNSSSTAHSPYVLTTVIRKKSLLNTSTPRATSPALLATMLWTVAQTADSRIYHEPGSRERITNHLYSLILSFLQRRDIESWHRVRGGWQLEEDSILDLDAGERNKARRTFDTGPRPTVDDILTYTLLAIAISGGEFKADCLKWWNKAVGHLKYLRYHTEQGISEDEQPHYQSLAAIEEREERRRTFWLVYTLDRHLALSHNRPLHLLDSECHVLQPLPENIWQELDTIPHDSIPSVSFGPPVTISGTGLFEYFLPLMTILGDIIEFRLRRHHPRLRLDDITATQAGIEKTLIECEQSITDLSNSTTPVLGVPTQVPPIATAISPSAPATAKATNLVIPYATYIVKVLYVLLHGEWDAISMLEDDGDWIGSSDFSQCASNSIAAAQSISDILAVDPELTFMPYLLGIYLFHGSFVILLFAERIPQIGPNASVEQACEVIIRAHEVSIVTL
ncbi:fungal specific transcription factor domain-containing protein, partial [Aspergillus lucknowensis]